MTTIEQLAASISATAANYRREELGQLTAKHVIVWAEQFDGEDRLPMLSVPRRERQV